MRFLYPESPARPEDDVEEWVCGLSYLVIPAKAEIQNVGSHRITKTSLFLDLRVKPEDDNTKNCPKMTKEINARQ